MYWQLREHTENRKLGRNAAVVTISNLSCPRSCPLNGKGCYAQAVPLAIHWRRVSIGEARGKTGNSFAGLAEAITDWDERHRGSVLRIGDAGQVTEADGSIHPSMVIALDEMENDGIVYVHPTGDATLTYAIRALRNTNAPINVSREGLVEYDPKVPQVTTVPLGTFAEGRRKVGDVVQCPAEYRETTCDQCRLCARGQRQCVVGFTAHGSKKREVSEVVSV